MRSKLLTTPGFNKEVDLFSKYLIKQHPSEGIVEHYASLMANHLPAEQSNDKGLKIAIKSPVLIPFLDGGLALTKPDAELRRRIFTLLSILEASPEYTDYFLPKKMSTSNIIWLALDAVVAIFHSTIGVVIVKVFVR